VKLFFPVLCRFIFGLFLGIGLSLYVAQFDTRFKKKIELLIQKEFQQLSLRALSK